MAAPPGRMAHGMWSDAAVLDRHQGDLRRSIFSTVLRATTGFRVGGVYCQGPIEFDRAQGRPLNLLEDARKSQRRRPMMMRHVLTASALVFAMAGAATADAQQTKPADHTSTEPRNLDDQARAQGERALESARASVRAADAAVAKAEAALRDSSRKTAENSREAAKHASDAAKAAAKDVQIAFREASSENHALFERSAEAARVAARDAADAADAAAANDRAATKKALQAAQNAAQNAAAAAREALASLEINRETQGGKK
jgi:hypothetical protein